MNRIIKSYLQTFSNDNFLDTDEESRKFEYFANYCITFDRYPSEFDFREVTSGSDDEGIDGIAFLVDNELATTIDEVKKIFDRPKKNICVDILFIQAKTSEIYDYGEILKFTNGVKDFISETPQLPQGDFIKASKNIFEYIIKNVSKVKNGRPNCFLYYACTTTNEIAAEIKAAQESIKIQLNQTGLFSSVDFEYIDTNKLIKLWGNTENVTSAILNVRQFSAYPTMSGITEAYVAIVSIKEFIDKVLENEEGRMRNNIFEENVRAFLGEDNAVNSKMIETLNSDYQKDKFAIFNNGITIISPDVRVQNNSISLENYQIVNGCQTSSILYECRELNLENAYVTVKIIEVSDTDVIANIVRATNNQSKVEESQFLSYNPFIRRLEKYFDSTQDVDLKEIKLFLERRLGQYNLAEVPKKKIFTITEVGRALGALFLGKPDMASRYPNKYIVEMASQLFSEKNKEEAFYVSALVDYRLRSFYQKNKVLCEYSKYKWHIITLFGYLATSMSPPSITNVKKITSYANKIKQVCFSDEKLQSVVSQIPDILKEIGLKTTRDEVRSAGYAKLVLGYCNEQLKQK